MLRVTRTHTKLFLSLLLSLVLLVGSFVVIDRNLQSENSLLGSDDTAEVDGVVGLNGLIGEALETDRDIEKRVFTIPLTQKSENVVRPDISPQEIDPTMRAQLIGAVQEVDNEAGGFNSVSGFLNSAVYEEFENGTLPIDAGEYFFVGIGNWNQGHGLGFSQYGAKGGALDGMGANQIAKHYFKGSSIGSASNSNITIEYCQNSSGTPVYYYRPPCPSGYTNKTKSIKIETYLAGIGEIPDKACGTQEQVNQNPDKYVLPQPGLWEDGCWPENAIKAQIIVSRSFALAYNGTICTTAACQVYKGGSAKQWAAEETESKVLMTGGSIINAYFSSDNNNGWGSGTHRKPMWCWDLAGNCGEGFSWLQGVYDNDFAAPGPYDDYVYRSNGYSLADFDSMINWYKNNGWESALRSYAATIQSTIGTIQGFDTVRDSSCRVHKFQLLGSSGNIDFNGDKFTGMYNEWVMRTDPSGQHAANGNYDFISSLTYYPVRALQDFDGDGMSSVEFFYDPCKLNLNQPSEGEFLPI